MLPNYHIIQVRGVGATNHDPARVQIKSERFEQWIIIPYPPVPQWMSPAIETAITYLENKGFKIIGQGEGKGFDYLISDTFEPIK